MKRSGPIHCAARSDCRRRRSDHRLVSRSESRCDALPQSVKDGILNGSVDLKSPATTLVLLQLDAVIGLKGRVDTENNVLKLKSVGTTCALCHSTVDNSFLPGIGKRLDGWPNRDLNVGMIIALSPAVPAAEKELLNKWGKGFYDPRHNVDGLSKPVVIPPAYGLAGINKITFTGDGDDAVDFDGDGVKGGIAYWNRYVSITQMGGLGTFSDSRLPLTVTNGTVDLVTDKLSALQAYQESLPAPPPPAGSFDAAAAARGKLLFEGKGQCSSCHSGPLFTDANVRLHPVGDSVVEPEIPSYASRSATKMYRTSPLKVCGSTRHTFMMDQQRRSTQWLTPTTRTEAPARPDAAGGDGLGPLPAFVVAIARVTRGPTARRCAVLCVAPAHRPCVLQNECAVGWPIRYRPQQRRARCTSGRRSATQGARAFRRIDRSDLPME